MAKNIIIGLLVVAVLIGGGYYLSKKSTVEVQVNPPAVVTPPTANPPAPAPTPTPTAPTAGAPVVITGGNPAVSSSTAVVTGQVKPNGALTTYWYEYGESTALGTRTASQQIGSGYSLVSTPAFITGLKANTTYYFRLSANNRFATVNGSTDNFKTNTAPPPAGVAPTTRSNNASNVARATATVNGAVNPNGWPTDFWFEFGKDNDLGNVTTVQSAGNGKASTNQSASLSNLEPQTKYFFRINAQNQFGTVNGSILNFTTLGPATPSKPSVSTTAATNLAATAARLNGRINPNGAESTYWFEYSLNADLGVLIGGAPSIQTLSSGNADVDVWQNVTGLVADTTYYYRLVGRNSVDTVRGSIVSFKTAE